jgi:hypothetical protein
MTPVPLVVESRKHRQRSRSPRGIRWSPTLATALGWKRQREEVRRREKERVEAEEEAIRRVPLAAAGPAIERGISVLAASASAWGEKGTASPLETVWPISPSSFLTCRPFVGGRWTSIPTAAPWTHLPPNLVRQQAITVPGGSCCPPHHRRLAAAGRLLGHDLRSRGGGGTAGHRVAT